MKLKARVFAIIVGCIIITTVHSSAQYATRKLSKKQEAYIDSIKQIDYPYIFPILGQGAYKRGFDIPYPVGAMGNYIWMKQGIVIDNFQLGFQSNNVDLPMTPVDFIEFGENINTSYAVNFRPDLWIFPFLNVYGLFGYGASTTEVNLVAPIPLYSSVTQNMTTQGFGVMSGFGLGPVWVAIDANWTWTKPELLEDPVLAKVLGIRMGKTFQFANKPESNVAFWIGGMRARLNSETLGSIRLGDALPQDVWDRKDQLVADYYTWYDGLDPITQKIVDNSPIPDIVVAIDERNGDAIVGYGMDKRPKEEWNMVVGAQYQLNKRWMLRTEGGIIGDRKSFLASVNYRFRL